MNADEIMAIAKDVTSSKMSAASKKAFFGKKHSAFAEQYPFLFTKCCESDSGSLPMVEYMVSMLKNIQTEKMTEDVASTSVGQKLFDDYVKPVVDTKEGK